MFITNGYTKDCEGRDRSQFKASCLKHTEAAQTPFTLQAVYLVSLANQMNTRFG